MATRPVTEVNPSDLPTADPERKSVPLKLSLLIGGFALLLALGRHLPFASQPYFAWESDFAQLFQRPMATYWKHHGLLHTRGKPVQEILLLASEDGHIYANHPPLCHWLIYGGIRLFGESRQGYRMVPTITHALAAFLLAAFAASRLGIAGGISCALIYNTLPMTFFYGRTPNFESLVTLFALIAHLAYCTLGSKRSFYVSMAFWFTAALTDWVAVLLAGPAVLLMRLAPNGHKQPLLAPLLACLAAFVFYFYLLTWWTGSMEQAIDSVRMAANAGIGEGSKFSWDEFFMRQKFFWIRQFSWAGILFTAFGAIAALVQIVRRRSALVLSIALAWLIGATLNVFLFLARSISHEMWWYYASPAVALFGAVLIAAAARRSKVLAAVILVAAVFLNIRATIWRSNNDLSPEVQASVQRLDSRFGCDTVVLNLTAGPMLRWRSKVDSWIPGTVRTAVQARKTLQLFLNGEFILPKLALWFRTDDADFKSNHLPWFLAQGGKLEVDGDSSYLHYNLGD